MSLSPSLYKRIIENWLTVPDLGALDTALCNKTERRKYNQVLQSGVILEKAAIFYERIKWLISRNVFAKELTVLRNNRYNSYLQRLDPPESIELDEVTFFNRLSSLSIEEDSHKWIAFVMNFLVSSTSLKELSVFFVDQSLPKKKLEVRKYHPIIAYLPAALKSLTLHQCMLYHQDVLLLLLSTGFNLTSVSMSVSSVTDDNAVKQLLRQRGLQLSNLCLTYHCENDIASIIGLYCANLLSLSLLGHPIIIGSHLRKCLKLASLAVSCADCSDVHQYLGSKYSLSGVKDLRFSQSPHLLESKAITNVFLMCPSITRLDLNHCNFSHIQGIQGLGLGTRLLAKSFDVLKHVTDLNLSYSRFDRDDCLQLIHTCLTLKFLNLSHCEWICDDFLEKLAGNPNSTVESIDLTCCHGYNVESITSLVNRRSPKPTGSVMSTLRTSARMVGINVNNIRKLQSVRVSDCCLSCQDKVLMKSFHEMLGPEGHLHVEWSVCPLGFIHCVMCTK